ncbi:MAG TPA: hypothetical protein PLB89_00715 [Flavobacteriales bacterium]|nr:hypothetical protein [Flavobacteriales bacterium]
MVLPSGLPAHVADHEVLARHIFDKKRVRTVDGKSVPKAQAFMPVQDENGDWVLSVSRVSHCIDNEAIERNGISVGAAGNPQRVLFAFTTITAAEIRAVPVTDSAGATVGNMDVVPEEPPPCHAHIIKYPDIIPGENPKELQKDCAEDLSQRATPVTFRRLPLEPWEEAITQ